MTNQEHAADSLEIEVSDFGPIVNAKVDLRPLTLFVGPNNAGKSYVAMLIYALHRFFSAHQFPFRRNSGGSLTIGGSRSWRPMSEEAVDAAFDVMRSVEEISALPGGGRIAVSPEASEALRSGFAARADLLADEIGRCFGLGDLGVLVRRGRKTAARLTIRRLVAGDSTFEHVVTIGRKPALKVGIPAGTSILVDHGPGPPFGDALDMLKGMPEQPKGLPESTAWPYLAAMVLPQGFGPLGLPAYYLPADRAGAMRLYKLVARTLLADAASASPSPATATSTLTGVAADFLGQLIDKGTSVDAGPPLEGDLGKSLESAILDGAVRIEQSAVTGAPHFLYCPTGWKDDLELANASSMVSELAPVVLYLRHLVQPGNVLIVEEPESHLHPAMQVELTRQLAKLVAAGIRVIVTTHSEWLIEELANVVRRSKLPEAERARVSDSSVALDPTQVGAWRFSPKKRPKGSVVKEVPLEEYGFCGTGFDEVASALHNDWADVAGRIE